MKESVLVAADAVESWDENDLGGFLNEIFDESLLVWETENSLMRSSHARDCEPEKAESNDPYATPAVFDLPMEPITPQDLKRDPELEAVVVSTGEPEPVASDTDGSIACVSLDLPPTNDNDMDSASDASLPDIPSPSSVVVSETSCLEGVSTLPEGGACAKDGETSKSKTTSTALDTFLKAVESTKTQSDSSYHYHNNRPPMSEHERAVKRRERNRILAKETRLRKKHNFATLQSQFAELHEENQMLRGVVKSHIQPSLARDKLLKDASKGLEKIPKEVWDAYGSPRVNSRKPKTAFEPTRSISFGDESPKSRKRNSSLVSVSSADSKVAFDHPSPNRKNMVSSPPQQQQKSVAVVTPTLKKPRTVGLLLLPSPSSPAVSFPVSH